MNKIRLYKKGAALLYLLLLTLGIISCEQASDNGDIAATIEARVLQAMKNGDIPGLSLIIINNGRQTIKSYGYADLESKKPVTAQTLFQIGSCSKAFTALAVARLFEQNKIKPDHIVSDYLPWFRVLYKGEERQISIRQLLYHTSGIPWNTISKIPAAAGDDALDETVRQLIGQELNFLPGKEYEYATINYDVLALIIQQATGQSFEEFVSQQVIGPLQLANTTIGVPKDSNLLATGYKIGFFKALPYKAPVYRGNNAAGYIISDATDIAKWMSIQLGTVSTTMDTAVRATHRRDETVPLHDMSAYAMGWHVSLSGNGQIYHGGMNPNYSSFIAIRPQTTTGVGILTNSNSHFTAVLANDIMKIMSGEELQHYFDPGDNNDKVFSTISFILLFYLLVATALLSIMILAIIRRKRQFAGFTAIGTGNLVKSLLVALPLLYGIYVFPAAFTGFSWESMLVWAPVSFKWMILLILAAIALSYLTYFASLLFPEKNKFRRNAPRILLLSILSGIANMIVITIVTSALYSDMDLKYLLFYYALTVAVYLLGRKIVQSSLIVLNAEIVFDIRVQLVDKIFSTSYQKFEKLDRGRIYTAMNDDVNTLANSANMVVVLITSFFTAAGAFLYLASIAMWATVLTFILIVSICAVYFLVSKSTNKYFEEARDTQNVFMRMINGMIDGFKEISMHAGKKRAYEADIADTADRFKTRTVISNIRFVNAFLVGESLLIVLLGMVVFALPRIFPAIEEYAIMSFVIILLYLIGPVNGMLNSVPGVLRIRVAWNRIHQLLKDIPANLHPGQVAEPAESNIESIKMEKVTYQYPAVDRQPPFSVGPVSLEVKRGELLFIIGGNGSGKTTLSKLLTGLYLPESGKILINNKPVSSSHLSEYFSAVFSPVYLFEKLYDINTGGREEEIQNRLQLLDLEEKVQIKDNRYSTIDLSGGQRKRLALLQCYLENKPVCLFDEWAADQDPEYRNFFYRVLLPDMKAAGKIIIAITHDDHYFDVADKILKMDEGKPEIYMDSRLKQPTLINGAIE